jgi:putative ABC transport system permease protein
MIGHFLPPGAIHRFFRWFCHPSLLDAIEGDLIELYHERRQARGRRIADLLFAIDVLSLFRPSIIRPVEGHQHLNQYGMFKNYLTIGWRTLLRNKGYSAINIGGLAAGLMVTILIGLWVIDELSFNQHFENYESIGHVMVHNGEGTYPSNPIPLAEELRTNYKDQFKYAVLCTWTQDYPLMSGDKKFSEAGVFTQPEALDMLSLDMVYGSRNALKEPSTIVISQSVATKFFGDANPVGETIRIRNSVDVMVSGVYEDFPMNTDFSNVKFIGSWDFLLTWMTWMQVGQDRWDNNSNKIYVQLNPGVTFEAASESIHDVKMKHLDEERKKSNPQLFVHPMTNWHLHSKFVNRHPVTSEQMQFVWLYGIIGTFVLILACINFMNLSTARSEQRAKEVGIRKTMGSMRRQLIVQFFSESFITVALATFLSVVAVWMLLPMFNDVAGKQMAFPWNELNFWLLIAAFAITAGLLSGSYPALFLSSFKPIRVLKGVVHVGRGASLPRKILVVIQFTVSVSLIVGTIVVFQQIQHARNRPVGYNREGLVMVMMSTPELYENYNVIRNELLQTGVVENVAKSSGPVTDVWSNNSGFEWEGKDPAMETNFVVNQVTAEFGSTVGFRVVDGRDFSDQVKSDTAAFIINQAAVKYMSKTKPVGEIMKWGDKEFRIVGVVEDIIQSSPYKAVLPTIFLMRNRNHAVIDIRLSNGANTADAIGKMSAIFQKYNPSAPFQYKFADDEYDRKFASEVRVGKLALIFAMLAIFISCLGLLGLASFVAARRTKEIGVRKVVGASVWNIWLMLSRSFVGLVTVACFVAFPLTWYFLTEWLTKYEYRVGVAWWLFPLVVVCAILLTLITVSYQAIRVGKRNPVLSLRSE